MICPGTNVDCDNPGCRHGGCQGRLPELPLFQATRGLDPQAQPEPAPVISLHARAEEAKLLAA